MSNLFYVILYLDKSSFEENEVQYEILSYNDENPFLRGLKTSETAFIPINTHKEGDYFRWKKHRELLFFKKANHSKYINKKMNLMKLKPMRIFAYHSASILV